MRSDELARRRVGPEHVFAMARGQREPSASRGEDVLVRVHGTTAVRYELPSFRQDRLLPRLMQYPRHPLHDLVRCRLCSEWRDLATLERSNLFEREYVDRMDAKDVYDASEEADDAEQDDEEGDDGSDEEAS